VITVAIVAARFQGDTAVEGMKQKLSLPQMEYESKKSINRMGERDKSN